MSKPKLVPIGVLKRIFVGIGVIIATVCIAMFSVSAVMYVMQNSRSSTFELVGLPIPGINDGIPAYCDLPPEEVFAMDAAVEGDAPVSCGCIQSAYFYEGFPLRANGYDGCGRGETKAWIVALNYILLAWAAASFIVLSKTWLKNRKNHI